MGLERKAGSHYTYQSAGFAPGRRDGGIAPYHPAGFVPARRDGGNAPYHGVRIGSAKHW